MTAPQSLVALGRALSPLPLREGLGEGRALIAEATFNPTPTLPCQGRASTTTKHKRNPLAPQRSLTIPAALAVLMLTAATACAQQSADEAATQTTAADPAANAELLTDFSDDLPQGTDDVDVFLVFEDIRPLPSGQTGAVTVRLQRRDGQWTADGHHASADYNQKSNNTVEIDTLTFDPAAKTLTGSLDVTINPDSPRPGGSHHMGPFPFPEEPDRFTIDVEAEYHPDEHAPFLQNTEPWNPPWRNDTPTFGGRLIEGGYTTTFEEEQREGDVIGAVSPAGQDGRFNTEGNIVVEPAEGGGAHVLARLSPERVADKYSAAIVKRFEPRDWSDIGRVRLTVDAPERRNDAAVAFGVHAGGRWYTLNSAAMILKETTTFDIPLDWLDIPESAIDEVDGIRLGVTNPFGVGDVVFNVRRIELLRRRETREVKNLPVVLQVHADTILDFDGQREIPKGLFGFHDVGQNSINQRDGETEQEAEARAVEYMRDLRPGYMRPLTHVGFGGDEISDEEIQRRLAERREDPPQRDDLTVRRYRAGEALDNVVWTHTVDLFARPDWMREGVEAWERKVYRFYRNLAARAWVPGDETNLLRKLEVWNEPFFWGRHMNDGRVMPEGTRVWEDETQYGYIPGKLGAEVYAKFFLAAVEGGSANPHLQFGGPSAPSYEGDHYGNFFNYVKYFIDAAGDEIDFLTEHHYGGRAESYAASYEVAAAYTDLTLGRRIPTYNTEANLLHAPDAATADYNIRDILACIEVAPDVAVARAIHACWNGFLRNPGEEHAYRALNQLRGTRLVAESSDESVRIVASRTDDGEVAVFIYNRSGGGRTLDLSRLPGDVKQARTLLTGDRTGHVDLGDTEGQRVEVDIQPQKTRLLDITDAFDPAQPHALPDRSALALLLTDVPAPNRVRHQARHFVELTNQSVDPDGGAVTASVNWRDFHNPAEARQAVLRFVARDVHPEEAVVRIGEQEVTLPVAGLTGQPIVHEVALDPAMLRQDQSVELRVADPARQNGYTIYAMSILLERERPRRDR